MATTAPIHAGEVLAEEFLQPLGISPNRLAAAIGVPPRRINDRSSTATAESPLTPRCACRDASAPPTGSGQPLGPLRPEGWERPTSVTALDRIQPLRTA